ncbi:F-box domain and ankyrin repeat protein [Aspergillus clavatus NRRL 1]|uniref:F-box domain and ankyrin repeat protein n=1 Tax=Aspergillus clavatus (strain ATCC 1007 / CBS 513.65 / DSM 816 / NCTC 3887 / NRRL 1 / QM 1276 / 107) TaxID=344612 RepID=A1CAF6_ASPCL|nr:F-box domain and ankyrin repeat protein [Aspergillus clavatus NRRL 1]EAW12724.1 F-box domain and ankyrin repeat protein [Aspergillus clavatus NRRL 1]
MPPINMLPTEMVDAVGKRLDRTSLVSFAETSKAFKDMLGKAMTEEAREYALADESEYKVRIITGEDGETRLSDDWGLNMPRQPLFDAVNIQRIDAVKGFLDAGVDPDSYSVTGDRLLSCAVRTQSEELVDLVLSKGASPALKNVCKPYTSPLEVAAYERADHLAQKLMAVGAEATPDGVKAAIVSHCSLDTIKLAMEKGADFGNPVAEGDSVFHSAAENKRHQDVLAFFIEQYPDQISARNDCGETALLSALFVGNLEGARRLIEAGIDVNFTDRVNMTGFHIALEIAKDLSDGEQIDEEMRAELMSLLKVMLENGYQPGVQNQEGCTELHFAAAAPVPEILRELLACGNIDVEAQTGDNDETALHFAAAAGQLENVQLLVEEGNADVHAEDGDGLTPAEVAENNLWGEVAEYLREAAQDSSTDEEMTD